MMLIQHHVASSLMAWNYIFTNGLLLSTVTSWKLPVEIVWTGSHDLIYITGKTTELRSTIDRNQRPKERMGAK